MNSQRALAAVTDILPADARQTDDIGASNADYSKKPDGSCEIVTYSSDEMAAAAGQANPLWTEDAHKVSAILYSGNADSSDGSDRKYNPDGVHLALVFLYNGGAEHPVC